MPTLQLSKKFLSSVSAAFGEESEGSSLGMRTILQKLFVLVTNLLLFNSVVLILFCTCTRY